MLPLSSVKIDASSASQETEFPYNIPAIRSTGEIHFVTPVTFLVGENGSGKSTLLEAIAYAANMITVGSEHVSADKSLVAVRALVDNLQLVWRKKSHQGFFLRAEDFFGYVKKLAQMRDNLQRDLERVDGEYAGRSTFAKNQARMSYARELSNMEDQYGRDLDSFSHGESFLELFQSRLVPGGLYLLDEPEVPLSPSRQLTLISMIKHMVAQECQFIIATHSPILMAFPDATILSLDERPVKPVDYETLEHVTLTRSFLENPDQYLRHL